MEPKNPPFNDRFSWKKTCWSGKKSKKHINQELLGEMIVVYITRDVFLLYLLFLATISYLLQHFIYRVVKGGLQGEGVH